MQFNTGLTAVPKNELNEEANVTAWLTEKKG